mmetsp:Transcript_45820/g.33560  ORF Transcript_45820/g.33560 Transcript_45820/m.33560 type:complete len:88 (-) Transcript_45820:1393-1656(-)
MMDSSVSMQESSCHSLDSVLKIIFEGLGTLADIMPDEIGYIFLPKLKEQIIQEISGQGDIFTNWRVQSMFSNVLKNFQSVELSLSLF